ncbi:hypothetical protein K443DRAFT_624210 [Laccaria amethystina LaAM-08-1]|uniref:EKC/KEOPS complex subunit CGI121 n=1 Tax=Laccaria amethystina LaAM-08-1 TaxID=1095629 RepID=A0A0C9XD02_9AGAR|nr:hypothetical protein K443DRAFT_624210 [Laccaria amethystina LaAM-08-1]
MDFFHFPHHHSSQSVAHFALFRDVKNSQALRKRIIAAATIEGADGDQEREAVNFAFIDARLITGRLHLQTAISQAILADSQGAIRTKSVHSEILWALNPTNNITEALRRYGVSDTTTDLIVVRVGEANLDSAKIQELMEEVVLGKMVPFSELKNITDWSPIKKYHKLIGEVAVQESKGNISRERAIVDNIVISTVAVKTVMA